MKKTDLIHKCLYSILLLGLLCLPVQASAADASVPEAVETALDTLLQDVTNGTPGTATLAPLLEYVTRADLAPDSIRPKKRPQGEGCFARAVLHISLSDLLRYCYNPQIPGEALYPNVIRRHRWLPQSQLARDNVRLWQQLDKLQDNAAPVIVRAKEEEEITPDTFSGCFYTYTLDRMMLLLRHKGVNMLVSVARQAGPSGVGHVGAIVGDDDQWNYVYSQKVGSDIALAKWAETYMYDAATVTVLYADGNNRTGMALFKYVRAGWANMNMVKPKHIAAGIKRFLKGFKAVIESPSRPSVDDLAAEAARLRGMDENALRAALLPYAQALSARSDKKPLSSTPFKELVADNQYAAHLNKNELVSELVKRYVRQRLGKTTLGTAPN